jgi:hypothetical protein
MTVYDKTAFFPLSILDKGSQTNRLHSLHNGQRTAYRRRGKKRAAGACGHFNSRAWGGLLFSLTIHVTIFGLLSRPVMGVGGLLGGSYVQRQSFEQVGVLHT